MKKEVFLNKPPKDWGIPHETMLTLKQRDLLNQKKMLPLMLPNVLPFFFQIECL
jgi:hypothetical protein